MPTTITGIVKNGVVVPSALLPENAQVEIHLHPQKAADSVKPLPQTRMTPSELRRLPREQRQLILAQAAERAEHDYRTDKELTGFEAFSEEELDGDSDSN